MDNSAGRRWGAIAARLRRRMRRTKRVAKDSAACGRWMGLEPLEQRLLLSVTLPATDTATSGHSNQMGPHFSAEVVRKHHVVATTSLGASIINPIRTQGMHSSSPVSSTIGAVASASHQRLSGMELLFSRFELEQLISASNLFSDQADRFLNLHTYFRLMVAEANAVLDSQAPSPQSAVPEAYESDGSPKTTFRDFMTDEGLPDFMQVSGPGAPTDAEAQLSTWAFQLMGRMRAINVEIRMLDYQFPILDGMFHINRPDLTDEGLSAVQMIDGRHLWDNTDSRVEPDETRIRQLAHTLRADQFVNLDVEHWHLNGDDQEASESLRKLKQIVD